MPDQVGKTSHTLQGIYPFLLAFIQRGCKDSERLVLQVFPNEEFLHEKINRKDVYKDYGAIENTSKDVCSLGLYQWRFDRTELR